jgi:hypothetical protein
VSKDTGSLILANLPFQPGDRMATDIFRERGIYSCAVLLLV